MTPPPRCELLEAVKAETMEEMLQEAGFSREGELALAPARASL